MAPGVWGQECHAFNRLAPACDGVRFHLVPEGLRQAEALQEFRAGLQRVNVSANDGPEGWGPPSV